MILVRSLGHTKLISCFWSYKSLKNDQATRLFFFFFFGNQSGKKKVYKQQNASWRVRSGDKTSDNCVSKEPKYRSLDGEATECREN